MPIIDRTYFKGEIRLANITDVSVDDTAGNGPLLDRFINKYEREVLVKCLGYPLFKLFKEQFDIDATTGTWTLKDDADSKWDDLLNGTEYQINGESAIWKGLVHTDSDIDGADPDHSLIAYYVYSKFVTSEEYSHAGVGFQREKPKNSEIMDATVKSTFAFNSFKEMVDDPFGDDNEVGLYQFLRDMNSADAATYPGWNGECFTLQNRYGL
ncbi:MAG: hypothetical protein CMD31_00170 [Flavobacteriales bacterium]|nr:hypothetical protein [Flavobacteriales bacterium]